MPFNRPTPQQLRDRIKAEIEAKLQNGQPLEDFSPEMIIGLALAMVSHELHGHLAWLARQILPDTAEQEFIGRHAGSYGINRAPAIAATGVVRFTGEDDTVIPAGTIIQSRGGVRYIVVADATITGGVADTNVTAEIAGLPANLAAGLPASLVSPIAGVNSGGVVQVPGIIGGADAENDTSLQARTIRRRQQPPHGGSNDDYIAWGQELAGVTRVFPFPVQYGAGTVGLTFLRSDRTNGIPDAADVENMQAHIDSVRPVTADVTVFAPNPQAVDIVLSISPDTAANRAAAEAEITDFFAREATPGGTIFISRLREAISAALGEFSHELVSPTADVVATFGNLPVKGNITWGGA